MIVLRITYYQKRHLSNDESVLPLPGGTEDAINDRAPPNTLPGLMLRLRRSRTSSGSDSTAFSYRII